MADKSPAFQWYPKDILASARVQMMSLAEECAYRRLIDFCWLNGSIPADPNRAARLVGKGCSVEIVEIALEMFIPDPNDQTKLIHERLEEERKKQALNSEKRKKASEARWSKRGKSANGERKQVNTDPDANAMQMQSKADTKVPSKTEVNSNLTIENGEENQKLSDSGSNSTVIDAKALEKDSKCNANAMQMDSISSSTSTSVTTFSSSNEKEKGGGSGKPPPTAAESLPKNETLPDYLLRKQLDYPQFDVQKIYDEFVPLCGSAKYPKLKNSKQAFDKWLETQWEEFEKLTTPGVTENTMTDEKAREFLSQKYGGKN